MALSLTTLYKIALDKATSAAGRPTIQDDTQELVQDALADLMQLSIRVTAVSLFSPNDVLDDISTPDLVYLSLPFIHAELENRVRTTEREARLHHLIQIKHYLRTYVTTLDTYDIVPETERALYTQQPSSLRDAAQRRELKIRQYKAEKDLRMRIHVIRRRRRQPAEDAWSDFQLVASLLVPSDDNTQDVDSEDVLREATLLLLRLFYAQACAQLEGIEQEIELLNSAPPPPTLPKPPAEEGRRKDKDQADLWKLDAAPESTNTGPLLDLHGKPLRPFTILPAGAADRVRLQAQVFGPGHRLPTMTIDEYLEIERQRGGIISGGGPQSANEPTSSEQLTIDSEMKGTVLGDVKSEEKRRQDEQWAQYKDTHPRGAGNTMNRG